MTSIQLPRKTNAARDTYGARRVSDPIPTPVKVEEAPAAGSQTIFEYQLDSKPTAAYWNLVERSYANA